MELQVETSAYNERRYGKPWIAKVDFSQSNKGEFIWGDWIGDARNGGAGTLVIDAQPGDIIARGQRDNRKMQNSSPDFYVVRSDGSMSALGDRGAAYKYYLEHRPSTQEESLLMERNRLMERIAEIDAILGTQK